MASPGMVLLEKQKVGPLIGSTEFFFLILFFKLYIIVLVLPNIKMNPPQVYMCSPSWTLLPPPSPLNISFYVWLSCPFSIKYESKLPFFRCFMHVNFKAHLSHQPFDIRLLYYSLSCYMFWSLFLNFLFCSTGQSVNHIPILHNFEFW